MKTRSQYKYTAFISYRHVEPDASVAAALHKAIETFKTPKDFYEDGKAPSFRVFRDREELSAKDLSDSIQEALEESYYLIVISSKRTPLSPWCTKEVELFRELHGDERILSVLIEGEPYESFSKPMMELKKRREIEGKLVEEELELLAAELRPKEVQKRNFPGYEQLEKEDPARLKRLTKESLQLLKTEKYRVMAAILGCSYGDLRQRDKERKNKRYLQISAFFSALFLIFGLFMLRAYQQENIARREASQTSSTMLLQRSRELLEKGDKIKALLVADEAMGKVDEKMELYTDLKEQHKSLLSDALYPVSASLRTRIDTDNTLSFMDISPKGDLLAVGIGNDSVGLFDATTGELLEKLSAHREQVKLVAFSPDGKYLLSAGLDSVVNLWDVEKRTIYRSLKIRGIPMMTRFSLDGRYFFLAGDDGTSLRFIRQDLSGEDEEILEVKKNIREVSLSSDGEKMLVLFYPQEGSYVTLYNFKTKKWEKDYFEPVEKEKRSEIVMARLSEDGKSFYMRSRQKFYRLSLEDGKPIFAVDFRFWENQARVFKEYKKGSSIIIADNSVIRELDRDTGKELGSNHFEEGIIREISIQEDTGMVAVALESGKVALWKQGLLVDAGVDLGGAKPNQIIFQPEGKRLYVGSRTSKEIYYLDLENRLSLDAIEAQIASISPRGKKVLFLNNKEFFLWDTDSMKEERKISKETLGYRAGYMIDNYQFALSDDGKKIAFVDFTIEGEKRSDFVYLVDLEIGEQKQIPIEAGNYLLSFVPGSEHLALAKQGQRLFFMDFEGKEQFGSTPLISFLRSLVYSQDGTQVAISYEQGKTQVLSIKDGKLQAEYPGEVLWFDQNEVRGIYNRSAYVSSNEKINYHSLDEQIDKVPISEKDYHLYDAASERLLLIRNGGKKPVAYLLDFRSGRLLKSFYPALSTYTAKGFFQGEARDLVLDQSFDSSTRMEDSKEVYYFYPKSLQFHFADYETLLNEEVQFLGKRKLSPEERKELGLEE